MRLDNKFWVELMQNAVRTAYEL